ncbi:hypothetical protein [Paenibacillus rigui]|uniref:hypothetical protein n=1 Tax=Paenibacillus rigui TaxID=554312 RepID=UPI001FEBC4B4|nr:hypothetical protein [Paenibacillus rigui]
MRGRDSGLEGELKRLVNGLDSRLEGELKRQEPDPKRGARERSCQAEESRQLAEPRVIDPRRRSEAH